MNRIYFMLLLMLPFAVFAQMTSTSGKNTTKYEDFVSKPGIKTTYTYPMGTIQLHLEAPSSSYSTITNELIFSIIRINIGNTSASFLQISHEKNGKKSSVMVEESNVIELYNSLVKIKEIVNNPVPEGAKAQYTYLSSDGVALGRALNFWSIQLDRLTNDYIQASNLDPLITKLHEITQKMDSIK